MHVHGEDCIIDENDAQEQEDFVNPPEDNEESDGLEAYHCVITTRDGDTVVGKAQRLNASQADVMCTELHEALSDASAVWLGTERSEMIIPFEVIKYITIVKAEDLNTTSPVIKREYGYGLGSYGIDLGVEHLRHAYPTPNLYGQRIGGSAGSGYETPLEQRG